MTKYLIILFSFLIAYAVQAQVTVTASAPGTVDVGEEFQLNFAINAEPSGFQAPVLTNFNILAGPSRSSSTSVSIVNGRMSQSVSINITYVLQAQKAGKFTIDAAKVTVNGKNYNSNPLSIEVVGSGAVPNTNNQQTQQDQSVSGDDKLFLKVITDKSSLYMGEYLTATVKLYSQWSVNDVGNPQLPKFNGVYTQEIDNQPNQLNRENINGKVYLTGVLKQYYLFPQQKGDITIDACSFDVIVAQPTGQRQRNVFDDFWGFESQPAYQWVKRTVKSQPFKINVKPLPAGAPESFNGAVGTFTFKTVLDKKNIKTNDAVSLKITISGTGNIKLIEPPVLKLPPDFETFDPKTNESIKGVSGTKTFEYVMIARHSGTFTIPAVEFTYFDPQLKQYKTQRSEEFTITVEKNGNEEETSGPVVVGGSKDDVKYLGKDIRYIKTNKQSLLKIGKGFFGSLEYYLAYGVSLFLFLLFVVFKRKQIVENANIARVRNKRAGKQARKRLKLAASYLEQNKAAEFYDEILRSMWCYLGDKLNIPASELSREKVMEMLASRKVDEALVKEIHTLLDNCEMARYAPSIASVEMKNIYGQSVELISKFENLI